MTKDQSISLQERIVKEITSTYNSIAEYKNYASKGASLQTPIDPSTAARRIQVVEHKLKALKMMLAKIDDEEYHFCDTCHKPMPAKNDFLKRTSQGACPFCS